MKFNYYSSLYLKLGRNEWKNSTYEKNKGIVKNRLYFFEDMEMKNIKPSVIKLWLNEINDVSNKSKKHYLNSLSMIFQLALEDEEIIKNPIIYIKKLHHQTPKIKPFISDEVIEILKYSSKFNDRYQMFLKLGFYTGMRTGEIISLKFDEVDLSKKVININSTRSRFGENSPKTPYSIRTIPIINLLYDSLKEYKQKYHNNTYLIETQYKKPYRDNQVFTKKFWRPTLKALNLEYRRLYNMRHTYATNMLYHNIVTPVQLAKLLGHSNPKMIYDVYVNYLNLNLKNFDRSISIY